MGGFKRAKEDDRVIGGQKLSPEGAAQLNATRDAVNRGGKEPLSIRIAKEKYGNPNLKLMIREDKHLSDIYEKDGEIYPWFKDIFEKKGS